jgi:hypothetical protein
VAVPAVQEASRQEVDALGYVQLVRVAPSQVPPQAVPSAVQPARVPTGAPDTGEQVPSRPGRLQASH